MPEAKEPWWTETRVFALRQLWDEGLSETAIAAKLGTTKSAVAGKAHRLDLPMRGSPLHNGPTSYANQLKRHKVNPIRRSGHVGPTSTLPTLPSLQGDE